VFLGGRAEPAERLARLSQALLDLCDQGTGTVAESVGAAGLTVRRPFGQDGAVGQIAVDDDAAQGTPHQHLDCAIAIDGVIQQADCYVVSADFPQRVIVHLQGQHAQQCPRNQHEEEKNEHQNQTGADFERADERFSA